MYTLLGEHVIDLCYLSMIKCSRSFLVIDNIVLSDYLILLFLCFGMIALITVDVNKIIGKLLILRTLLTMMFLRLACNISFWDLDLTNQQF